MRIGSARHSYQHDEALFDSRTQWAWVAVLGAVLCAFPFVTGQYWQFLACLVGINIIAATGLNVLTGYTGQVSLGHAAFMGIGAYAVAVLDGWFGQPVLLNLLVKTGG